MSRKRHRPEEIVAKLRQVEVLTAQGQSVAEAIRSIGVTEVSSGTSCSTARSSPRSRRPRSSSRAGVGTTTPFDRTRRSAPSRPRRRSCCGRRSFPNQLRRPPRPWRSGLSCTNTRPAPLHGGRPCSWPDPTCTRLSEQSASPSWIIPRSRSGKGTDETSASTWRGDSAEAEPPNFVSAGRSKGDS